MFTKSETRKKTETAPLKVVAPRQAFAPSSPGPRVREDRHTDSKTMAVIDSLEDYFQRTAQIRDMSLPRWVVY